MIFLASLYTECLRNMKLLYILIIQKNEINSLKYLKNILNIFKMIKCILDDKYFYYLIEKYKISVKQEQLLLIEMKIIK